MAVSLQALAPGLPEREYTTEHQLRIDLAACYRLVAHFGMDDMIFTHISLRVPGPKKHFLINPYGMGFDEVTASSLVKIDIDGNLVEPSEWAVNPAGFVIHSAIHAAREDAACVLHTHTVAGMAVAASEIGLLPISQHAMEFHNRLACHDYEGIALELDERERLVKDLGDRPAMMLRNHGLLSVGRTVAEAFHYMYYLEQACRVQVAASAMGKLRVASDNLAAHTAGQFQTGAGKGERMWRSLLRKLDRIDPGYRA